MSYDQLKTRHLTIIQNNPPKIPEFVKISTNKQTRIGINLPITETCNPTKKCKDYCYGVQGGNFSRDNVITVEIENLICFNYLETASQEEVDKNALHIAKRIDKEKMNWIRWNGVGDLIPGSIRVINALAVLRPDIIQWIVTRKPELVSSLSDVESISILFSLDVSTPETIKNRAIDLQKKFHKAKFRFSWVRTDEETEIPSIVHTIFNVHYKRKRFGWEDKRVCEVTLPGREAKGACNNCRKCFA